MISRVYIEGTLDELDRLYSKAPSQKKQIIYSKMAILELCGWIELSIDDIAIRAANRTLRNLANRNQVKKEIVRLNYGFDYEKNVRQMLMKIVGLANIERAERRLYRCGDLTILKAMLDNLKIIRNSAVHTFLKGTAVAYDSPSLTMANFRKLYDLVLKLNMEIERLSKRR